MAMANAHDLTGWSWTIVLSTALIAGLGPLIATPLAGLERRRLLLIDRRPVTAPTKTGLLPRYTDPATWRELAYAALLAVLAPALIAVLGVTLAWALTALLSPWLVANGEHTVALWPVTVSSPGEAIPCAVGALILLLAFPYLLALLAGVHGLAARALLQSAPNQRLREELVEVSRSRARLVDAFEAERHRIERDLHDGAQQSLLGLTLQISMARLDVPPDSPAAERIDEAHRQAKDLMNELRELIRGIHPRVLTDRGLTAALGELADKSPLRVTIGADLPGRPPAPIETTAYFVVAEALANAAKHADATTAAIHAHWHDALLTLQIEDDGQGGADPERGTGLTGLADRVAVIDGRMFLASPPGGPTTLRVELPCHLSE
ncbi:sensor domain-containing protein [Actinomadura barringtoniae]|uniref:histidine kinase n=2 Tax=Actinomadura barringtoniae TaxID=1427535 RepID=A0A939PSE4_9ACTN|nr:sensor domain-containing protein [Actinomadura barringtoniae]